jgi:hypothetical protein
MTHPHEATTPIAIDPWTEAFERADQFAEKLKEIATDHGADAVDLTIEVVRFGGIATIGAGIMLLLMALLGAGLFWWGFTWYSKSTTAPNSHGSTDKYEFFGVAFQIFGGGGFAGFFIATTVHLVDIWAWIAIFAPKIALAKKLIDSVL